MIEIRLSTSRLLIADLERKSYNNDLESKKYSYIIFKNT